MKTNQPMSHSAIQPKHIAIIMDGNGRWAKSRGLPRTAGHKKGIDATKAVVKHAGEIGIEYLTLFAFSTENWNRPDSEINDLMSLLRFYLKSEAAELHKNNVRLRVVGFRERLSKDIVTMIENVEAMTVENTGLNLTIALDYGSRQEILHAVQNVIAAQATIHDEALKITEQEFSKHLLTSDLPDPDLLIRTSGEQRISNFMLWQCAYSEFYFTDIPWPDFTPEEFNKAITCFNNRERRFGGLESVGA